MTTSADDLIGAFCAEFGVALTDENRFGSVSLGWLGVCDGAEGVQWNTWLHRAENAAYVAVNLEGLKYDGWPIARFIEREFRHTRLFEVARQLAAPESIQMIFHRDAWRFASRPAIEERHIGLSSRALTEIDPEGWKRTLQEAYECLDPTRGHRHRGRSWSRQRADRSSSRCRRICSFPSGFPARLTGNENGLRGSERRRPPFNRSTTT